MERQVWNRDEKEVEQHQAEARSGKPCGVGEDTGKHEPKNDVEDVEIDCLELIRHELLIFVCNSVRLHDLLSEGEASAGGGQVTFDSGSDPIRRSGARRGYFPFSAWTHHRLKLFPWGVFLWWPSNG